MSVIERSIDVDVPVGRAYEHWTRFGDFPRFMEGVQHVEQLDESTLRWRVSLGGAVREFDVELVACEPDQRIAWHALDCQGHAGSVTFEALPGGRTRVTTAMSWEPDLWTDRIGEAMAVLERRCVDDLEQFRLLVEARSPAA